MNFKKSDYELAIKLGTKNPEAYIKLYELQDDDKDINLIYKSIEIKPTKWAYYHLFYFYSQRKETKKLNQCLLDLLDFFEKTNYEIKEEDKKIVNSYFGSELENYKNAEFINNNPIKIENIKTIPNKLECVVLLLTGKELENGYYNHFLNQIKNTNKCFSKKLDFKIITNKKQKIEIKLLKELFNSVEIIKSKIPEELDFYLVDQEKSKEFDLTYGLKSGPNYIFFETFQYLTQYNTTLFLECDCYFGESWLERICNFVNSSGGFWISGALYDGKTKHSKEIQNHINGGVALYATGNPFFLKFIKFCADKFYFFVEKEKYLAYDCYIRNTIDNYYSFSTDLETIKFINRQYVFNNLIFNYSTMEEIEINNDSIKNRYNYAILHKKMRKANVN